MDCRNPATKPPKDGELMGMVGYIASSALKPAIDIIWYNCLAVLLTGAGLFAIALLSWLFLILWKKVHSHSKEAT